MKPYGGKPLAGTYYDWFVPVDERQPQLDDFQSKTSAHSVHETGSNRFDTVRPNIKIEFGVNEIRVTGGGKKSRTFNDGANGKLEPGVGDTGEDCFHFSPTHDASQMKIKIQVHHPHFIQSAKLEMFCRGHKEQIWSRCWGNLWKPTVSGDSNRKIEEIIPPGKNDGTADFEIDWSEIKLSDDLILQSGTAGWIYGVPDVPRSPYQLRFSVSARAASGDSADKDKFGFPLVAWTFAHVLVKEIKLAWGKDELIPRESGSSTTAVSTSAVVTKTEKLQAVSSMSDTSIEEERALNAKIDQKLRPNLELLKEVTKNALSPGQGDPKALTLELNLNVPAFEKYDSDKEFTYFQSMWNGGPLVPMVAAATIKKIDGSGVEDRAGLGRAQFLWEWQDNEDEDLAAHLDTWLTNSSSITKFFIKKVFEDNQDKTTYPNHGFNCPSKYGGKRGTTRPAPESGDVTVFPKSPAKFPNPVAHELKKRNWGAISYADPETDLKDREDKYGSTAVLFQPSIVAGDRFRVSVCLVTESLAEFDKDLNGVSYYDLLKDATNNAVPWASTYYFEIWRHIKSTFYNTPGFNGDRDRLVTYIEAQMKRELGFKLTIEKKPFPDVRQYLQANLGQKIRELAVLNDLFRAAFLRVNHTAALSTADYAFDVITDASEVLNAYKTGKWFLADVDMNAIGREILGSTSNESAIVSLRSGTLLTTRAKYALRMLSGGALQNAEPFTCGDGSKDADKTKGTINGLEVAPAVLWDYKFVTDNTMDSSEVKISVPGVNTLTLTYAKGTFRTTRDLSDQAITNLKKFRDDLRLNGIDQALELTITGKANDTRSIDRTGKVKKWIEENILFLKGVYYADLGRAFSDTKPRDIQGTPDTWDANTMNRAFNAYVSKIHWRKLFNAAFKGAVLPDYPDWERDGHAFFFYLRGRNVLDNKHTNGAIENDWSNERFGLAGVFQPALVATDKVEKRWLKSPEVVTAHEFGHLFMLQHSPPRVFDSKEASGEWPEHLSHDACLMNYDPDTTSLCGWCMLRKRGWQVKKVISDGNYIGTNQAWVQECKRQMETDAAKGPANKVRLAMFLTDMKNYDPSAGDKTAEATRHMHDARQLVPEVATDEKHIFLLRCEVIYYDKIGNGQEAKKCLDKLLGCTTFPLDTDDVKNANGGVTVKGGVGRNWKLKA